MDLKTGALAEVEHEGAKFFFAYPSHKQLVDLLESKSEQFGSDLVMDLLTKVEGLTIDEKDATAEQFRGLYKEKDPTKGLPGAVFGKLITKALVPLLSGEIKKDKE